MKKEEIYEFFSGFQPAEEVRKEVDQARADAVNQDRITIKRLIDEAKQAKKYEVILSSGFILPPEIRTELQDLKYTISNIKCRLNEYETIISW